METPALDNIRRPYGRVFYGWWLAIIGAVVLTVATAPSWHALPLWLLTFSGGVGWTAAQLSRALALARALGIVTMPIAGWSLDKLGPRKMVIIGLVVFAFGFFLLSLVANLWMYYLSFAVMSVGSGLCSWIVLMAALNNWFRRRRATAMSIPAIGAGLGGVTVVPLMAWSMGVGWRATALAVGIIALLVAASSAFLVRNRPEDYGQHPDGITPGSRLTAESEDAELTPNLAAACLDVLESNAALSFSRFQAPGEEAGLNNVILLVVTLAFPLIGGLIGDRMQMRNALSLFAMCNLAAFVTLFVPNGVWLFFPAAVLMAAGVGALTPLRIAVLGAYFGRARFATIYGSVGFLTGAMAFSVTFLASVAFSALTGNSSLPVALDVILAGVAVTAYRLVGRPEPAPSQLRPEEDG